MSKQDGVVLLNAETGEVEGRVEVERSGMLGIGFRRPQRHLIHACFPLPFSLYCNCISSGPVPG